MERWRRAPSSTDTVVRPSPSRCSAPRTRPASFSTVTIRRTSQAFTSHIKVAVSLDSLISQEKIIPALWMLSVWTNYKMDLWAFRHDHKPVFFFLAKPSSHLNFTHKEFIGSDTWRVLISRLSWKMWEMASFVTANVLITAWWIIPFICWQEHCHSIRKQPFHCYRRVSFSVSCLSSAVPSVYFWKFGCENYSPV